MRKLLILGIVGTFFLIGWKSEEKIITEIGTIKYIQLEGGFYGIIAEGVERYLPVNLPGEFKKDGLRVRFKAKPKKVATIHMWGKPIEILEMKEISEVEKETKASGMNASQGETSKIPEKVKEEARRKLSRVKVAVWYQTITDYKAFNRTMNDVITHLKETRTDFVFRAFWRWNIIPDTPCPSDPVCSLPGVSKLPGLSYQGLEKSIRRIKSELSNVIICGGVPFERLNAIERNPITGEILGREKTWAMALDPSKWGINISKEKFQENRAKVLGYWHPSYPGEPYNWKTATAYYPDITNPEFQELLLSWAKKQIDCGVDAIWVDLLFAQPVILARITKDENHPAVRESFEAASKIIDEIHAYGIQKYGKYIYVGTWPAFLHFGTPDVDFATAAPVADEVRYGLFENKWNKLASISKEKGIPVFAFMDEVVGSIKTSQCGMAPFSQEFPPEKRRKTLEYLDKYFSDRGITFIYPVHGPWMGYDAKVLSFGKFKICDALAPEFETYETLKELAQRKKLKKNTLKKLKNVKVAAWYQYLTGGRVIGRGDEDAIRVLKDLNVDLVRGWWRWKPLPFSPKDVQFEKVFGKEKFDRLILFGQTWQDYVDIVKLFKKEMPNSIFMASFGLQFIPRAKDRDPITGEIITRDKAWEMAFDPQKHGFKMSKAEYQCIQAKKRHWVRKDIKCKEISEDFVKNNLSVYWGDPTNEDWQNFAFHIAQKLIDGGADAIWIDQYLNPSANAIALHCLEEQETIKNCDFSKALKDKRVKEIINTQKEFIDRIHKYGLSKGKYVLVGSWGVFGRIKAPRQSVLIKDLIPNYDFVVTTITSEEIYNRKIDPQRWKNVVKKHRKIFGNIPMFVWFDTGYYHSPMHIFSQYLNKEEQVEFLKKVDKFFVDLSKKENSAIVFIYPISGQMMGPWKEGEKIVLSFQCCCDTCKDRCLIPGDQKGKCGFGSYDALATEFETYETMKELAQKKKHSE